MTNQPISLQELAREAEAAEFGDHSRSVRVPALVECCPRCSGYLIRDVGAPRARCAAGCGYRRDG